jgi:hypothetical protein
VEDLVMFSPSALRIGRTSSGYCLRVEGRATHRQHPALLELFVVQVLDHAPCTLVVDLTDCEHLDGRFLDTLLDLQRHYGLGPTARFTIAARGEMAARLAPTRLDIVPEPPASLGNESELPPMEAGTNDLEAHLVDWHRRLALLGVPFQLPFEPLAPEMVCR